jgi:hypothetical protein
MAALLEEELKPESVALDNTATLLSEADHDLATVPILRTG